MRIKISPGNQKLGDIPNISLAPIYSCPTAPCNRYCYAVRIYHRGNTTRRAWKSNLDFYKENPINFFFELRSWLTVKSPTEFRWHVGGDIPDYHYFWNMLHIAREFPNIKFLAFTKRYLYIKHKYYTSIPKNLTLIFSVWPGWKMPRTTRPKAFILGDRRAKNYIKCVGRCDRCYKCFNLSELKKNVLLQPIAHYKP